ncbi:porin family protein [Chryseobacterium cheonjiense]|uniref:PorT family protein n=1 Tax=Chryseobacterium cheonjiense TaxID=2728845 RepID=A0A7Y0FHX9_9FLAO|nr:porin family protein [Chryseobacterium cheonjiense]NML56680.1 PorT family protein [Chryseobacterium cheonjiense]
MKKVLVATAMVLGFFSLNAQQTKEKNSENIQLIPKAGIAVYKQSIEGVNGEKSKVGFQAGLGVNIPTGAANFSIQPELNFISKGTKIKNALVNQNFNFNYIEVPVLAKYSFGPVYVNAGPSVGFLMGKNNAVKAVYGKTKTIDFGLQMGAGVAIPAGPGKLIVDGRYNLGLSNISDAKGAAIKNRGFAVSLGYAISL